MKRTAIVVLVATFVAVDLVLLTFALGRPQTSVAETRPTPGVASSSAPAELSKPNGSVTLIYTSGALVRLTRGQCTANGRPKLEVSRDLGVTFREVALPLLNASISPELGAQVETVNAVLNVSIGSPTEMTLVASDSDCKENGYATDDGGASWKPGEVPAVWSVDAAGTGVISPSGSSEPGCDVVALSPLSERNAKVACTNGIIRGTDDSGGEWVTLGRLDGVTGALFAGVRNGWAVAPDGDCRARAFSSANAGNSWTRLGCIAKDAGATSLVGTPTKLFVLIGEEIHLSTDGGKTWQSQESN